MGGLPVDLGGLPTISNWPLPRFYGTGGSPATWVVYPLKAAARILWYGRSNRRSPMVYPLEFPKSGSLHFSNSSLTFTLTNSLVN
ncbi:hypothetical protein BHE74_00031599 [Ensete ventricosum]|nr:hypothetical protein BHE74_00031599 [Ensete ventricosum]